MWCKWQEIHICASQGCDKLYR